MDPIVKVTVTLLNARDYPAGVVRLPAQVVAEVPHLLDAARKLNPATTLDDVIRAIFRYGVRNLRNTLQGGEAIDTAKLPGPQKEVAIKEEPGRGR